jgi:hypothetical protein
MFSAVDGFRTTTVNVANGYFSTFSANSQVYSSIPSSDGNTLYLAGAIDSTGSDTNILWMKVNNINGARISSQKVLGNATPESGLMAALDSGENSYVVGSTQVNTSPSQYNALITKYSSSGSITWQEELIPPLVPTGSALYGNVACEAGGGNIYASGYTVINTGASGTTGIDTLVKYNSSGTIVTQERTAYFNVANTAYDQTIRDLTIDSSNNLYITGYVPQSFDSNVTYKNSGTIQKRNSSGTVQWDANFYDSTNTSNVQLEQTIVDTGGNVYVCGTGVGSSPPPGILAKVFANGTIDWIKDYSNCDIITISLDDTGNLYAGGRLSTDATKSWYASIDESTGNVTWQNFITCSTGNTIINDINYANNYLYLGGYGLPASFRGFSAKLPSDGNSLGTFGAFTISTGNVSTSSSSVTNGGNSFGFSTTTYADTTGNVSISNGPVARKIIPL